MRTMNKHAALAVSLVLGASLIAPVVPAEAKPNERSQQTTQLTLLATTDLHGRLQNWDYFKDAPYSDRFGNKIGLSAVSTIVDDVRDERGEQSVIVVDNGDFLQGTPMTTYYAKQAPVTETGEEHPMATGYNAIGYDAQAPGNHEFDYGLDLLDSYVDDADFPVRPPTSSPPRPASRSSSPTPSSPGRWATSPSASASSGSPPPAR